MSAPATLGPTAFDVAGGVLLGDEPEAPSLPALEAGVTPRSALEDRIRSALERPPCVVAFSGGRDSSTLLAVAAYVARRDGLELPVPASLQFPSVPEADESRWQAVVVRHLALEHWHRIEIDGELELLGEESCAMLGRRGVSAVPYMHAQAPLARAARGGSFLTGFFANTVFGDWRWERVAEVRARRTRPELRDGLRFALAVAPRAVRRAALARRHRPDVPPWLTDATSGLFLERLLEEVAAEPVHWGRRIAWCARRRVRAASIAAFRALGQEIGTSMEQPYADRRFLAALTAAGGKTGLGGRTAAMRALAGDLLPDAILRREHPPGLARVFWGESARDFAERWCGEGLDTKLVEPDRVRAAWAASNLRAAYLLQAAWLASTRAPTRASAIS